MLIETHCHLLDRRFDGIRDAVITRARNGGISKLIEVACEPDAWHKAITLVQEYDDIYCTIGLHPHDAKLADETMLSLIAGLLDSSKVLALGEAGLDYHYDNSPRDTQIKVFLKQIEIAVKKNKPLIIHAREAYDDIKAAFTDTKVHEKIRCAIHCFSGNRDDMLYFAERGCYFGIDGPVTFPSAKLLAELAKEIPIDKLLLETDSPYLSPQTQRGKLNEPANLVEIASKIAMLRSMAFDEVARITTENAKRFFEI